MSVWIRPAAPTAVVPAGTGQARTSLESTAKKLINPSIE